MSSEICGIDDGATVCALPRGHVLPHESEDGRRFLWVEGDDESRLATWLNGGLTQAPGTRVCANCNVTHGDPSLCPWVI
jgi:hypothetical protein